MDGPYLRDSRRSTVTTGQFGTSSTLSLGPGTHPVQAPPTDRSQGRDRRRQRAKRVSLNGDEDGAISTLGGRFPGRGPLVRSWIPNESAMIPYVAGLRPRSRGRAGTEQTRVASIWAMYVIQARIENVRSIEKVKWKISPSVAAGWHVILGENGSGKTSFLRSIALALVGTAEAPALRQDWDVWLRRGCDRGGIEVQLDWDRMRDKFSKKGAPPKHYLLPAMVRFSRSGESVILTEGAQKEFHARSHVWGGRRGWFSASYGPSRRFLGGNAEVEKLFHSHSRLARHLSVFGENVALSEPIAWIKQLDYESRTDTKKKKLLADVRAFVNQDGFLPHGAKLVEVSPDGVIFRDGNDSQVDVEELSDGYRSLLSMTFELLRQLVACYGPEHVFHTTGQSIRVRAPGVVLIDEVDAHLHPTWQLRIGLWMRAQFPKIQFIVSTHSPLICQAADVGTVWRLPRPGTDDKGKMLVGEQLDRVLFGNPVEAYGSEGFNLTRLRSDKAEEMLVALASLNQLELRRKLTKAQQIEQARLRGMFPTSSFEIA